MHLYSSKTNPNPILSFWPYGRRSLSSLSKQNYWFVNLKSAQCKTGKLHLPEKGKRVVFSPDVISRFHYRFNDCFAHIQFFIRMFWISWCFFFPLITFDILFLEQHGDKSPYCKSNKHLGDTFWKLSILKFKTI